MSHDFIFLLFFVSNVFCHVIMFFDFPSYDEKSIFTYIYIFFEITKKQLMNSSTNQMKISSIRHDLTHEWIRFDFVSYDCNRSILFWKIVISLRILFPRKWWIYDEPTLDWRWWTDEEGRKLENQFTKSTHQFHSE